MDLIIEFNIRLNQFVIDNKKSNSKYEIKKLEKEFIKNLSKDEIKSWKKAISSK